MQVMHPSWHLNTSPLSPSEVVVSSTRNISATDRNIDDGETYKYLKKSQIKDLV